MCELLKKNFVNNDDGLQIFCDNNNNTLNRHAPSKRKHVPVNQVLFITKDLTKETIKRPRLCNGCLKNGMEKNKVSIQDKGTTVSHF